MRDARDDRPRGGTVVDDGGRPVVDDGGRPVTYDGDTPVDDNADSKARTRRSSTGKRAAKQAPAKRAATKREG